ncbi:hypothetical protein ACOMHN_033733 [Nucella lapillus]
MKGEDEVYSAAEFIGGFVQKANDVTCVAVEKFKFSLAGRLRKKYARHWYTDKPFLGSAFRSINIDHDCIDPLITGAFRDVPLDSSQTESVMRKLPKELTLWVDPAEVSYRFGDHGSIGVLFSESKSSAEDGTSDYESDASSPITTPLNSPPRSPYDYRQQSCNSIQSYHQPTQCRRELLRSPFPNRYQYRMETSVA